MTTLQRRKLAEVLRELDRCASAEIPQVVSRDSCLIREAGSSWKAMTLRLHSLDPDASCAGHLVISGAAIPSRIQGIAGPFFLPNRQGSVPYVTFAMILSTQSEDCWGRIAFFDPDDIRTLMSATKDLLLIEVRQPRVAGHRPVGEIAGRQPIACGDLDTRVD